MGRPKQPTGASGEVSVFAYGNGYRAKARVGDPDGVTRQVTATGKSRAAAKRALAERLANRTPPKPKRRAPTPGVLTAASSLTEASESWVIECRRRGKPSEQSLRTYGSAFQAAIRHLGDDLTLGELTPGLLQRELEPLEAQPETLRLARTWLRQVCGHAVRHDAIPTNPLRELLPVTRPKREVRVLTDAEARELVRLCVEHRAPRDETGRVFMGPKPTSLLPDAVVLMLGTGLRIGECLALRWDDIDLDAEPPTLSVTGTLVQKTPGGLVRQAQPKTGSGFRTLALTPAVRGVLARRRREARGELELVFATRAGTPVAPHNIRRLLRAATAGTGLAWVHPHVLRKTFATRVERALGPAAAAAALGHSGVAVTEAHYLARTAVHDVREAFGGGS